MRLWVVWVMFRLSDGCAYAGTKLHAVGMWLTDVGLGLEQQRWR